MSQVDFKEVYMSMITESVINQETTTSSTGTLSVQDALKKLDEVYQTFYSGLDNILDNVKTDEESDDLEQMATLIDLEKVKVESVYKTGLMLSKGFKLKNMTSSSDMK